MKRQANFAGSSNYGARLRAARVESGLNQTEFAKLGGVSLGSQTNYELQKSEPPIGYLIALGEAGIDVQFIVTGKRSAAQLSERESALITNCRTLSDDFVEALLALARAGTGTGLHGTPRTSGDLQHGGTLHDGKFDYRAD